MAAFLETLAGTVLSTALDVAPIVGILVFFQFAVLRRRLPNAGRIVAGFGYVLIGLTLFLIGLEEALFPVGETMARQLTAVDAGAGAAAAAGAAGAPEVIVRWDDYLLVYAFAAAIGFATTVAEPSLIAVALKAEEVSGGAVHAWGLRLAVAVGGRGGGYRSAASASSRAHRCPGISWPPMWWSSRRPSARAAPSCRSPTTPGASPPRW